MFFLEKKRCSLNTSYFILKIRPNRHDREKNTHKQNKNSFFMRMFVCSQETLKCKLDESLLKV